MDIACSCLKGHVLYLYKQVFVSLSGTAEEAQDSSVSVPGCMPVHHVFRILSKQILSLPGAAGEAQDSPVSMPGCCSSNRAELAGEAS